MGNMTFAKENLTEGETILHAGRCWYAYWLFPYPNQRELWPNFKSPLVWDVFAISTYLTISAVFFFIGLIPDIASLRDKTSGVVLSRRAGTRRTGEREHRGVARLFF